MKTENLRILVIGDIMLDKYIVGEVERISPEAPVPVVKVTEEYSTLGGCGNVVRNLREIGVKTTCIAAAGYDDTFEEISREMVRLNVDFRPILSEQYPTISKTRIIADERKIQMLRIDREDTSVKTILALHDEIEEQINEHKNGIEEADVIIVSDYAKGMISYNVSKFINEFGKKIIIDPKPQNFQYCYGAHMITPNRKEFENIKDSARMSLLDGIPYVLVTKGKDGMELMDRNQNWVIPPEKVHQVYNVSGAGDTVVSVMATCIAMGLNPVKSAKVANYCAAYVVTLPGTTAVPKNVFQEALDKYGG